jgi:drug/metabolite transporter (DMT)-like permease
MIYFLAVIPPFLDSIANYLDKFLLSKYNLHYRFLTLYSGFFAFITGIFVLLFTGLASINIFSAFILLSSGFLGIFYLFFYFKALTYGEGSRVGSLFQFIPVLVLFLSFIFLGEKLLLKQYLGSLFIIVAGVLLSIQKERRKFFTLNKSFWCMLLSCTFSAFVYVLFKLGVQSVGFWRSLPYEGFGAGLATLTLIVSHPHFIEFKKEKFFTKKIMIALTIVELITRISRYILFFVLTMLPASLVSIFLGFQPFFLLIIGIVLSVWFPHILKEVVTKKTLSIKVISVLLLFVGIMFIFL